ncbi:peptidoglycan editing factor PgeF [Parabacteroides sp. PF5-6]|uniref:peptidoglycan editing factor PgeF n=1 Tax=Parabacteroides sp. PF5-6 TaxID=1742403 RepID=UPI002405872C|nr:peptidoglycan editing factor PgeF [Parabacteroides sp. PF5-6]
MKRIRHHNALQVFESPLLSTSDGLVHFVTTRSGGVSQGEYASLNLGEYCGDEAAAVAENRKRLCRALCIAEDALFVPYQTHESRIRLIDSSFLALSKEQQRAALQGVDALITREPDVCIAVTTADCVPLLLYAPEKKVIAAVHAGWRGTVLQIAAQTVAYMVERFDCDVRQLRAFIGPAIGLADYEVGDELVDAFRRIEPEVERVIKEDPLTGKPHADLWEANRLQLLRSGLFAEHIEVSGLSTYSHPEDFFSARRQGVRSGRMLTGAVLQN